MNNTESKVESKEVELNKDEIYQQAIKTWGPYMQIDMCIEEMAELTHALVKYKRGKGNFDNIAEEIADVAIMLEQMVILFDCNYRTVKYKKYKLERLKGTLDSKKTD